MSETKKKGCLFYGCLTLVIIGLLIGIGTFVVYRKVNRFVLDYTAPTPTKFAPVICSDEDRVIAEEKVKTFLDNTKKGSKQVSTKLTDQELNLFIDSVEDLKEKARFEFAGNNIKMKMSIPLTEIPMARGRYLVGDATLKASCEDGNLDIRIVSFDCNGKPLPASILSEIKKKNLAYEMYKNPELAPLARRIKTIRMKDGELLIEVKPK